jgi:hypothetical protein
MIAAGVNAKALTTYLGHSSIQITMAASCPATRRRRQGCSMPTSRGAPMPEWSIDDWMDKQRDLEERFSRLLDEGLLIRTPDSVSSIEEVDDFIALVYWSQRPSPARGRRT